jgi:hypothetical protein
MKPFSPNGIDSWLITYFFISQHLILTNDKPGSQSMRYTDHNGYHALIPLAVKWANEFELERLERQDKTNYFVYFDQFIELKEKRK